MKSAKKLMLLVAVGAVLIFLSVSFTANDISSRGVVLGLGLDYQQGQYTVTAEIVAPGGNQDQQVGTFSSIVVASGDTVPSALANMYAQTGRQISLGQCQLLILGEGLYTANMVADVLPYFTMSDEYKDSSALCAVVGEAGDIMTTQLPLSKSISMTLVDLLKQTSIYASVPNVTLSRFAQSGLCLSRDSMCPLVQYVAQPSETEDSANTAVGIYNCFDMVLFSNFDYVSTVGRYNSVGYTLLDNRIIGQVYSLPNDSQDTMTSSMVSVYVTDKQVDISVGQDNVIDIAIDISLQEMSDTDIDNGGALHPQISSRLTDSMLDNIRSQIIQQAGAFLQLQKDVDVDIVGLFKALELHYGTQWVQDNYTMPLSQLDIALSVTVVED